MKEKKISFKTGELAYEKGFNFLVSWFYIKKVAYIKKVEYLPTQFLLQKWLREKYNLHVEIQREEDGWIYRIYEFKCGNKSISRTWKLFCTYEQALEAGLFEALKLINNETINLV